MIICASRTLSSVLSEKLLVKFSSQNHAPAKIAFADNQHKFDSRTLLDTICTKWLAWKNLQNTCARVSFLVRLQAITPFFTENLWRLLLFLQNTSAENYC